MPAGAGEARRAPIHELRRACSASDTGQRASPSWARAAHSQHVPSFTPLRIHAAMPNAFNFAASPFDCLTQSQQRLVRDNVDVAYFRAGDVILDVGSAPTHLFVLIKGRVSQFDGDEEVVAYELAHQTVNDLIAANADFGALLFSDLGAKLSAAGQRRSSNEFQSLNLSRVDEAFVRPAHIVEWDTDIVAVVRLFQRED